MNKLQKLLAIARAKAGESSRKSMAKHMGVSTQFLCRLDSGGARMTACFISKLLAHYDIKPSDLAEALYDDDFDFSALMLAPKEPEDIEAVIDLIEKGILVKWKNKTRYDP